MPATPTDAAAFAFTPVTTLLPEVRVEATDALTPDQLEAALQVPGVTFATAVAVGPVELVLPDGREVALTVASVDPPGFRLVSPQVNADAPQLWQRLVEGHAAVAHEVGDALGLQLGTFVDGPDGPLGIGAFATSGLPPLAEAFVDVAVGRRLGLGEPSTLLVAVAPDAWPDEVAEDLERTLELPATLVFGKPQRVWEDLPPDGTVWDRLARCESSGRWDLDSGNGYYGGLQFLPSSWHLVGGTGLPHEASRDEQIYRAELLLIRQGWRAWPVCSVKLGLREPDEDEGDLLHLIPRG